MIKIIAAVSKDGIIGCEGSIPWHYKEDFKFFKEKTLGSNIIMGRKTYESIGKPLPGRRNIVISKISAALNIVDNEGIDLVGSLNEALSLCNNDAWIIGGSSIYELSMKFADEIYLTLVPKYILSDDRSVLKSYSRFPWIDPSSFKCENYAKLSEELAVIKYTKI
jgi:dihydrofolate reductase